MNLEKVIFGFFTILACTLNFGFFVGDITNPIAHHPTELFATLIINLIVLVLKFGDRTHLGAIHFATSMAATLQLMAASLVWFWHVYINGQVIDAGAISTIVSISGGALVANLISVILLIGETLRQAR